MGVLDALRARGLRVPEDISVVGHNDMPLVDLIDPPLTTVRVAVEQMGRQAAQMLLELLGAPTQAPVTRMLLPQLIVRDSARPPPPRARHAGPSDLPASSRPGMRPTLRYTLAASESEQTGQRRGRRSGPWTSP
jgi:hypothetical protein